MAAERGVFTFGHSPDPDDAFMFYAMAENKIDLRGYRFEHRLEDIQTLNERALRASFISPPFQSTLTPMLRINMRCCRAGEHGGWIRANSCQKNPKPQRPNRKSGSACRSSRVVARCVIAVPGKMTSAFLALQLFAGNSITSLCRSIKSLRQ